MSTTKGRNTTDVTSSFNTVIVRVLSGVLGATTVGLMTLGVATVPRDTTGSPQPTSVAAGPRRSTTSTTSSTSTTSTTTAPVPTAVLAAQVIAPPPPPPPAVTTSCADALAYLASHQAPGFVDVCETGSALGRYGYTCWNVPGRCPDGAKVIHIACPAPFVYMNEAHNSWSLQGARSGIDPYGQGSAAEQAFCDRLR